MPPSSRHLDTQHGQIDANDHQSLYLHNERKKVVRDAIKRKVENQLPVFGARREDEKTEAFRKKAEERGLDPDWAEDFLRMVMAASRAAQSEENFPRSTPDPKHILFVGGEGGMGRLYRRFTESAGHIAYSIEDRKSVV